MQNKTNHSHFVREMHTLGVDFEQLWQDTMKKKSTYDCERAFDDRVETSFWAKFSQQYDHRPSLYDYAPGVLDKILSHTGKNQTMIEIGCGTGKFTLPMLGFARHIYGIDFSSHMLAKLSAKLGSQERQKLTLIHDKWEQHRPDKVDCIYCINAVYRMRSIRASLAKINTTARKKVVIVWTMQRSIFDTFINRYHKKGLERNQEYIHLMALLYELGLDPGLEMIDAIKPVEMDEKTAFKELRILSQRHGLPGDSIRDAFAKAVTRHQGRVFYQCPQKIALIHWVPDP